MIEPDSLRELAPYKHHCADTDGYVTVDPDAESEGGTDHATLRDGETRDDSHAARNAASIAALERELDDSQADGRDAR